MTLSELKLLSNAANNDIQGLIDPVPQATLNQIQADLLDLANDVGVYQSPAILPEIICDNTDGAGEGQWFASSAPNAYGAGSVYNDSNQTFTWTFTIDEAGTYPVYAWWTYHANRDTAVEYAIHSTYNEFGPTIVTVDQHNPSLGGQWNPLGDYYFDAGVYTIEVRSPTGQACADAVMVQALGSVGGALPPAGYLTAVTDSPAVSPNVAVHATGAIVSASTSNTITATGMVSGALNKTPTLSIDYTSLKMSFGLYGPYGANVWRYPGAGRDGWQKFDNEQYNNGLLESWNNQPFNQDVVEWSNKPRYTLEDFNLFIQEILPTGYVLDFDYTVTTPVNRRNEFTLGDVQQTGFLITNGISEAKKNVVIVFKLHSQEDQGADMAEAIVHTILVDPSLMAGVDYYFYYGNPGGTEYDFYRGTTDSVSRNANREWDDNDSMEVTALRDDLDTRVPVIDAFFDLHGYWLKDPVSEPYGYYSLPNAVRPAQNNNFRDLVDNAMALPLAPWGTAGDPGWAVYWAATSRTPSVSMLIESCDAVLGYPDVMDMHGDFADALTEAIRTLRDFGDL